MKQTKQDILSLLDKCKFYGYDSAILTIKDPTEEKTSNELNWLKNNGFKVEFIDNVNNTDRYYLSLADEVVT